MGLKITHRTKKNKCLALLVTGLLYTKAVFEGILITQAFKLGGITKTRLYNKEQFFKAVKIIIFR